MKHLQNIIQESLLDDFDTISNNADKEIVNSVINDPESKLWQLFDLDRREIGSRFPLKYNDGTLYIPRSLVQQNARLKNLESIIGSPVDNLVVAGGLYLGKHLNIDELTGDGFCKKISCGSGVKIRADVIKDIEIEIGEENIKPYKCLASSINTISFEHVDLLEGVKIKFENPWPSISFHQYDTLPKIKDCDLKGCKSINIYSPFLFDKEVSDLITKKWMIPDYEYKYGQDEVVKIKNFKKMVAVVNNPKKYGNRYGGNTPRAFKEDINASDVLPWVNNISPTLEQVTLSTNNVKLVLRKGPKDDRYLGDLSSIVYTKDGWNVMMYKKR